MPDKYSGDRDDLLVNITKVSVSNPKAVFSQISQIESVAKVKPGNVE